MAPLYLSRVATVVSLQQMQEQDVGAANPAAAPAAPAEISAGPDAPVSSFGSVFPKYCYAVSSKRKVPRTSSFDNIARVPDADDQSDCSSDSMPSHDSLELGVVPQKSLLDSVLIALWEEAADEGLFRYDVTACATKVVPGVYGFVAQLNEGRASKKRATEFRVDQVCQPFDGTKFNFLKAYMREVLFQFEPSRTGAAHFEEAGPANGSPNLVIINVSPIEYGHVLLVPRVRDCLPQLLDSSTVLLALHFALEAGNPYLRVGYNSMGAYATINHLHFQAYYLAAPFPIERAPTTALRGLRRKRQGAVTISRLTDYPVNGFVVEGGSLEGMAAVVGEACIRMQQANVPHNVLVTDSGARVFILPQCYAEKQAQGLVPEHLLDTGVNPACWEIAGHLVMKRPEDYAGLTEGLAWELLAQVSLTEERFMELAQLCFGCTNGNSSGGGCSMAAAAAQAAVEEDGAVPTWAAA